MLLLMTMELVGITTMIRTYTELMTFPTYEERLDYLRTNSTVNEITFGGSRYLNQRLYNSQEWKQVRRQVILRDNGCDLADPDRPITGKLSIHHIEPLTIEDLREASEKIFAMDNLVCVSETTHNAIHYGRKSPAPPVVTERHENDTAPWR